MNGRTPNRCAPCALNYKGVKGGREPRTYRKNGMFNTCNLCGAEMWNSAEYCGPCRAVVDGGHVPSGAPYEPIDAVEGGTYARDPNHEAAVRITSGRWPDGWLE